MFTNRLDLFNVVTVNLNQEFDYLSAYLETYVATVQQTQYTVGQHEIGRLDNISNTIYGTPYFWDLLARVNNIIDQENDMTVGMQLAIPTLSDYYNFYNANAKTTSGAFSSTNGYYVLS